MKMKKFTLLSLAILLSVVVFAQKAPRTPAVQNMLKESLNKSEVQSSEFGAFKFGTPLANVQVQDPRPLETSTSMRAPGRAAEDYVVITEQPEGKLKTYARAGGRYTTYNGNIYYDKQPGYIQVVWGTDGKVYFKDIISGSAIGTWVEGTLSQDGTTITVPLGQNIYYSSSYDACIAIQLINYDSETGFSVDTEATEVVFNVEDDVLSLQGTGAASVSLGAVWTDDGFISFYGDFESVYTYVQYCTQYDFDDSTMQGWTTIDADGDGYAWLLGSQLGSGIYGHGGSDDCVLSQSYDNTVGALTPDNYLVSPKVVLGGKIGFWVCAQDASYPEEHFRVYVSTNGNTDPADFEPVSDEIIMTKAPAVNPAPANASPKAFRSPRRAQGSWYYFEVPLTAYNGLEGYVAIRHFNCTDCFYLDVDDVTIEEGELDLIVNPEDITDGDIAAAVAAKSEGHAIRNITINLAEGGEYTLSKTIKGSADITINGNGATIDASTGDNIVGTDKVTEFAKKADGTESDHYYVNAITFKDVTIKGMKKALVRDLMGENNKTLLETLTIDNCVMEVSNAKPFIDFDSRGYVGKVVVKNSTIWAAAPTNKNFAKYGSKPQNVDGTFNQEFDVQNSTFVNISPNTNLDGGQNFNNISQKGTANNIYTLKNNIFMNCGKSGQVVVGFNGGQTRDVPVWDVDGNVFNWNGADVSATEVSKAGKKSDEDIVKNSHAGIIEFTDAANGDFNGQFTAAPVKEETAEEATSRRADEEATLLECGDPRWTIEWKQGYDITIAEDIKYGSVTTEPAGYAPSGYVAEGTMVTITATPDPADKFEVKSVKVEGVTTNLEVVVTPDEENPGVFTFTMPADAVVVSATFQRIAEDIIVNPEDIEGGDITAAINKKIAELVYVDPTNEEGVPGRVKNITINLDEEVAYTLSASIEGFADVTINGNGATIDASALEGNGFINYAEINGEFAMKDETTASAYIIVDNVTIKDVTIKGLGKSVINNASGKKTLFKSILVDNSVIEIVGDNNVFALGTAYANELNIEKSTIWSKDGHKGFFFKADGKPADVNASETTTWTVNQSTLYNIAVGKKANNSNGGIKGKKTTTMVLTNSILYNFGSSKGNEVNGWLWGQNGGANSVYANNTYWSADGEVAGWTDATKGGSDQTGTQLTTDPGFKDAANGDFAIADASQQATVLEEGQTGDPRWGTWDAGFLITIADGIRFGNVKTDVHYAHEGDVVTITATPDPADKFEVESMKVEGVNTDLEVVVAEDGTFTMPADAVIVSATFRRIAVDIIVNSEDITDGNIAAALDAKIASYDYLDPLTEEIIPVRIKNIYIYLAGGEEYTLTKTLTAPNSIIISGTTNANDELATIHVAEGVTDDFITLNGTETLAKKADGTEVADHKYITTVIINGVAIYDLKGAVVKDAQKTWLGSLAIYNSIIQVPDAQKNVIDFNGKGYVGHALVLNSTIYAEKKNSGFFAQYGSRPKNIDGNDTSLEQELYVQNSTFANIANGKNFCDLKQKGTAQNVYTIKNCIFADCGKQNQVVVGFNGGQPSATPKWDVDGNIFNWQGNDSSAEETAKAGQKDDEDIVKNSLACRVLFSDVEKPDFGGILVLAPDTEAPEEIPGDPRWEFTTYEGNTITVVVDHEEFGTASAQYPYAIEGEEVGLNIQPIEGYEVEAVIITDADGILIEVLDNDADVFTMYGEDVYVYVTFKKTTTGIDDVENAAALDEGDWFTINGVRIDKPTKKGLYIHNGRKVVMK